MVNRPIEATHLNENRRKVGEHALDQLEAKGSRQTLQLQEARLIAVDQKTNIFEDKIGVSC